MKFLFSLIKKFSIMKQISFFYLLHVYLLYHALQGIWMLEIYFPKKKSTKPKKI